jgi:hypothetical protein
MVKTGEKCTAAQPAASLRPVTGARSGATRPRSGRQRRLEKLVRAILEEDLGDPGLEPEFRDIDVVDSGLLAEPTDGFAAGTAFVEIRVRGTDDCDLAEELLSDIARRSEDAWQRGWRGLGDGSLRLRIYPPLELPPDAAFALFSA